MPASSRNKEETKRKLIDAVGKIFKTDGYSGLGVNRVARIAEVNKKLIYRYFGGFDRLVEAYVVETDYWITFAKHLAELNQDSKEEDIRVLIGNILINQFEYFKANREMQQLILWELSSDSPLMRSIHRTREMMGQQILAKTDFYQKANPVNFRAIAALLVGGIYYTILHTRFNDGMFTDVDLNTPSGEKDIKSAIQYIVDSWFVSIK